jgi:hypothetical protein
LSRSAEGAVEVYGESAARPVFSAEFDLAPQRAVVLALSELRLPPDTAPRQLEEVLPKPDVNPVENDLSRNALPYATALAGPVPPSAGPMCCPRAQALQFPGRLYSHVVLLPCPSVGAAGLFGLVRPPVFKLNTEIARGSPRRSGPGLTVKPIACAGAQPGPVPQADE